MLTTVQVEINPVDVARAIKITLPRQVTLGSSGDADVYGAEQHVPLMDIVILECVDLG